MGTGSGSTSSGGPYWSLGRRSHFSRLVPTCEGGLGEVLEGWVSHRHFCSLRCNEAVHVSRLFFEVVRNRISGDGVKTK